MIKISLRVFTKVTTLKKKLEIILLSYEIALIYYNDFLLLYRLSSPRTQICLVEIDRTA